MPQISAIPYLYNDGQASHPVIELLPEEENATDDANNIIHQDGNDGQGDGVAATITPSFVLDVTWPRVAVFYHPSSSVCQDLTAKFVQLARTVRHRSSRVPVAFHAVSCQVHSEICAEFNIKAVPVVLAFKAGRVDGIVLNRREDNTIDLTYVADVLELNLGPREAGDGGGGELDGIGEDANVHVVGGMAGSSTKHLAAVAAAAAARMPEHHAAAAAAAAAVAAADPEDSESSFVFSDAAASFITATEQTVYDPNGPDDLPLSRELAYALREYLDLLHWSLPSQWRLHDLINDLRSDYDSIIRGRKELLRVLDRHRSPGDRPSWSRSCYSGKYVDAQGGLDVIPEYSGYTCGLLRMFHISAIGVAQQHSRVLGDTERVRPSHVATVLRDYIKYFYGGSSRTFRRVYLEAVDNCMFDLCGTLANVQADTPSSDPSWQGLTIWLWNVHNHIRSSITSSPAVASQSSWPSQQECPSCYGAALGGWDYDAIFEHMKSTYWPPGVQNPRIVVIKPWRGKRRPLGRLRSAGSGVFSNAISVILLAAFGVGLRYFWIKTEIVKSGWNKRHQRSFYGGIRSYAPSARNGMRRRGSNTGYTKATRSIPSIPSPSRVHAGGGNEPSNTTRSSKAGRAGSRYHHSSLLDV